MKHTRLNRDTPAARRFAQTRTRMERSHKKLNPRGRRYWRRKAAGEIDSPLAEMVRLLNCDLCGVPGTSDAHHVQKRGMGGARGDWSPDGAGNLVALCRLCHSWVDDHPLYKLDELLKRAKEHGEAYQVIADAWEREGTA